MLLQTDLTPIARKVLDLRFVQGKTQAEISKIIGRSPERARQIIAKAIRDIRNPHNTRRNGPTLVCGLSANERIAEGRADICYECGKLIEESDPAFVVPGDDVALNLSSGFSHVLKLCCCRECAIASIKSDMEEHENIIMALLNEKYTHELAVQQLKDYQPEAMSLKEAHKKLEESEEL